MFSKSWLSVVIIPVAIALILYFVILPSSERKALSDLENTLIGTWENKTRNITIVFYENKTYDAYNNNSHYTGKWEITNMMMHRVNLNWEGFSADYMFMFIEDKDQLILVGVNEPAGLVYLSKAS